MTSWREIPGNERAFDEAAALVACGQVIGFAGAGASAGRYPLWSQAIEALIRLGTRDSDEERRKADTDHWRHLASRRPEEAAQEIRNEVDEGTFAEWIETTFGPRTGADGKAYTAVQASLARLPFAGYVTTNYDPGLEKAVSGERNGWSVRPFTWEHDDVSRWAASGADAFGERVCPLLYAHGVYHDARTVVLGVDGYRRIYQQDGPYRGLFARLWTAERLLFTGFSFDDDWLSFVAGLDLRTSGVTKVKGPRHVAIVPLGEEAVSRAGRLRGTFQRRFHAEALFYPVHETEDGRKDHTALLTLLTDLEAEVQRVQCEEGDGPGDDRPPDPGGDTRALAAWLDQVAAEHQRLRDRFPGRPAELEEIERAWVRLELSVAGEGEIEPAALRHEGDLRHHQPLERFLDLDSNEHGWVTGRWLVEGEPGAGKTTLLRRLAAELARAGQAGKGGTIPLFAHLPALVKAGRPLLDYLAEEHSLARLGEALPRLLESAGRDGRLLVLLDGLDEVLPEHRPRVARLLHEVESDWPRARVVVSSRPLGRGEPLAGFHTLRLEPLGAEQRRTFLERWFEKRCGEGAGAEAERACRHFDRERSLRKLSHNPLHLTLLAALWEVGARSGGTGAPARQVPTRRSALFAAILDMLLTGKHRDRPQQRRFKPVAAARQALAYIAHALTEPDRMGEPLADLEARLLDDELDEARHKIEKVWGKGRYDDFFEGVYEHTHILGPDRGGEPGEWRFWHRTFREALTAEHLLTRYGEDPPEDVLTARFADLEGDLGRWAEPLALLAGCLRQPDRLVERLTRVNRQLGLRALASAEGVGSETLRSLLGLTDDLEQRREVFLEIPDQLDDPKACLDLAGQLLAGSTDGNDLFFLHHLATEVANRWPDSAGAAQTLQKGLYDHIPVTEEVRELFTAFETADGKQKPPLWCEIPAGRGWIGSEEGEGDDDERPRHEVEVESPFWLAAVPVTRAQCHAFDPKKTFPEVEGVSEEELRHHPAVNITWYEAVAFCRWLAAGLGLAGARLPTEEEWEYACRARTTTRYFSGNDEKDLADAGWYDGNSGARTHRVAEKPANRWGLYDVHGNVEEWTASEWDVDSYKGRAANQPFPVDPREEPADLAAPPGAWRVLRGGGFWLGAGLARSAFRYFRIPEFDVVDLGFRVLLPLPPDR